MVVLSLNLEQQLSGKRFTACALSKSVTAISSQSTVDIYHDNAITSYGFFDYIFEVQQNLSRTNRLQNYHEKNFMNLKKLDLDSKNSLYF